MRQIQSSPEAQRVAVCAVRTMEALDQLRRARGDLQQAIRAAQQETSEEVTSAGESRIRGTAGTT